MKNLKDFVRYLEDKYANNFEFPGIMFEVERSMAGERNPSYAEMPFDPASISIFLRLLSRQAALELYKENRRGPAKKVIGKRFEEFRDIIFSIGSEAMRMGVRLDEKDVREIFSEALLKYRVEHLEMLFEETTHRP